MEDDGDERDDKKRKTRNLGEKKRRDQFNILISELSFLISNSHRKMDKSSVLKTTISFLKNHHELTALSRANEVQGDWKPEFLTNEEFTYLVMEALEGFIMVFSTTGYIHYVSDNISSLMGYNPDDIIDKNFFELTLDADQHNLYCYLQTYAREYMENQYKDNEMITFQVHLRQGSLDSREEGSYEVVQFFGHFRVNQEPGTEPDPLDFQGRPSMLIFVCIGCLCTPKLIRDVSLIDSTRNEFGSRHSLEWKFLFLDHRAAPIIGYLPFEVLGTSAYDYYHFEDLDHVVSSHKILIQKGELTSRNYRFLTKGQQWIWLQTRYYITYHQWTAKPESVVCTHRVLSYAEVKKSEEDDAKLRETNNTVQMEEVPVREPTPSPPYNISEPNTDGFAKVHTSDPKEQREMKTPGPLILRPPTPQFLTDRPLASQDPTPKSSMSSLTDLVEIYPGRFDPALQMAPEKVVIASSTGGETVTDDDTWDRAQTRYTSDSDSSMLEGSRSSHHNSKREVRVIPPQPQQLTKQDCMLVTQHGSDAQCLDSPRYASGPAASSLLPVTEMQPRSVAVEQARLQRLHRKHEEQLNRKRLELQSIINRQLEELRQVKEQLMMAKLGVLEPLADVPGDTDMVQDIQHQDPPEVENVVSSEKSVSPPHQQNPDHEP